MSDDSDKTQIKTSPVQSAEVANDGRSAADAGSSDKTRLSRRGDVKPDQLQAEELRKKTAQDKARELEKRLAEIKTKGNGSVNPRPLSSEAAKDETRVKQGGGVGAPSDKTQIKLKGFPNNAEDFQDKTVYKPKQTAGDKGVDGGPSDPTTVNDAAVSMPASGGGAPLDLSQYESEDILKNRFVFEKILGAGGMGVVYKATDLLKVEAQDRDPYVAIKVLSDEFKAHPEAFIALQRESRKTQRIAHPNIVNVHDFDRDGDNVFMTMEYLEGKPLDKLISQYKATGLIEEDAWIILEGICAALVYAHKQNIIHSDFKPGNIFVTRVGTAKVFDFGIARAVAKVEKLEESEDDKTVFDAGNLGALTPAYASLEMLEGKTPDVRDDIYALGCIAYEMFTGNHPFNRVHADEALRKKIKPKRITNISKRQWKVIEKSLAFSREDRVESVEEFWQQLTKKSTFNLMFVSVAAVVTSLVIFLVYQNYFAPKDNGVSLDEIRTEVERKFHIEQNQNNLAELMTSLKFSLEWENNLWQAYQNLNTLLGAGDTWLVGQKLAIYNAHITKINALMGDENFARARAILGNASRYTHDSDQLTLLLKQIDEKAAVIAKRKEKEKKQQYIAEQEKRKSQQQARIQSEKDTEFDVAMSTVNRQLQCRSAMNMRDIDIAVSKLRSLNVTRYRKAEANIVAKLTACIANIGRSFPERAEEFKKRALRIFPKNSTINNVKIEPKDPCDHSLAGLGARGNRAICRDILKSDGETIGKGPSMVVVPPKGSMKTFAIGKYEVTREDFGKFCTATKKCNLGSRGNAKLPITNIDIALIEQYLDWLSRKSKRKYRLPTRAEWIYASRSDSPKSDSNRNCRLDSRGIKKGGVLIKATTGQQNAWGLVNHLGNARELVVNDDGYSAVGGSYETQIEECVVTKSARHGGVGDEFTGFRIMREISNTR